MNGGTCNKRASRTKQRQKGFTIVETLIVLAVTGFLFISAAVVINGRSNTTSFAQATRDIQTQLQQTINEVGSGYYPSSGNIKCVGNTSTGVVITQANTPRGTNQGCIFLGKVYHFDIKDQDDRYNIYTIVGAQGGVSDQPSNLGEAQARVIAREPSETDVPQEFEEKTLRYGLKVSKIYYNDSWPANNIGSFAITSSLAGQNIEDSSQQINIVALTGTNQNQTQKNATLKINQSLKNTTVINPPGGVQICFESGGTKQSALMTIGGAGRQTTVDVTVIDKEGCNP